MCMHRCRVQKEAVVWIGLIPLVIFAFAMFIKLGGGQCYQKITIENKIVEDVKIPGGKTVEKYYFVGQGKTTEVLKKTFDNSDIGDTYKW